METEAIIKELIGRVNRTLCYYEKDYISARRTPFESRERIKSFEQYVEIRFNLECCNIPELYDAVIATSGHLFSCVSLENQDIKKRTFTTATIVLLDPETLPEKDNNLKNEIRKIHEFIGGSVIKFNNAKKKIKFTVEQ